ncbi:MAG TPA: DUF1223 domain-containing protein [Bacteriovoracaceae bacterium]|nr:DUF1223 domain-containing protein [Bacteriovoracaceae bacterium]
MIRIFLVLAIIISSNAKATVIELFTSQGCSSCPPAEDWISGLRQHPGFMKEFFPLVWHVDYWDRLGWKDTLARPDYTERQRRYSSKWKTDQVYTPGVVVDGEEKRNWRDLNFKSFTPTKSLDLHLNKNLLTAKFKTSNSQTAWLAIVSDGPVIPIKKGENAGRSLRQDFVVIFLEKGSDLKGEFTWKLPSLKGHAVVWIENKDDPTPLMTTALKLE